MTLTDSRAAFAEQNGVVHALVGLAGLARMIRALGATGGRAPGEADDFVHLLLGVASLGETVERLAGPVEPQGPDEPRDVVLTSAPTPGDLLR
jgi:hypothetical protein